MEINLLKNYNLTLADIHKQLNQMEDYVPQYVPEAGTSKLKKFIMTFAVAIFGFGLIAGIIIFVLDPFSKPVVIDFDPEPELPRDIVPPPPGYVQIQIIEFDIDGSASPSGGGSSAIEILPSISNPVLNPPEPEPVIEPEPVPEPVIVRPVAPPPPPVQAAVIPMYSVVLAGATPGEYDIIDSIAHINGAAVSVVRTEQSIEERWVVYVPRAGGVFVGEIEVTALTHFPTRDEAVEYAESYGSYAVIKKEDVVHTNYDLRVCCMELDDAKVFAQSTGITDKVFQLRRE